MDDNYDDFDDDDLFAGMSEIEKIEEEDALMEQAFNNSFRIITEEISFSDLIEERANDNKTFSYTAVAHNTDDGPSNTDLENIIIYFQEREEYEKCAVIHKILTA
jgi:hypothetical protein